MSGRGPLHIDVKRPRPPRMPLKTPTPSGSSGGHHFPAVPTPPSTSSSGSSIGSGAAGPPMSSASSQQPLVNEALPISIELEKLHIGDDVYVCGNDDLEDRGSIGEGHFGVVAKMYHFKTKSTMAVKKIPMKDLRMSRGNILELDVIKKAKECPFIVHFYGCLLREGHVWICMELLDSSMAQVSEIVYNKMNERIPEDILGKMSVAVIKALHFLQKELKIIHRDVKPSNILVSQDGEFKLCDFGISGKLVDSIAVTMDVGCRPYMAPERIDPARANLGYTIQSDVWSYGITLIELAQGSFPYEKWNTIFDQLNAVVSGPPPVLSEENFTKELKEFTAACLEKDPEKRLNYEEIEELKFFKIYNSGQVVVDTSSWYQKVKQYK